MIALLFAAVLVHTHMDCGSRSDMTAQLTDRFQEARTWTGVTAEGVLLELYSAATGIETTEDGLNVAAERIFNLERAIEIRYGRTRKEDETVLSYFEKPDSNDGTRLDRQKFQRVLDSYYKLRGWDVTTGKPTKRKLQELNLSYVIKKIGS